MKNKIIAVIGIIALSLIIINMSASHSKLSKTVDSKNSIQLKTSKMQFDFDYTGNEQTFEVPVTGKYKIELWGAQGGNYTEEYQGGKGGYVSGTINLNKNDKFYVEVGGTTESISAGYNGGGLGETTSNYGYGYGGGGASDIRIKNNSLNSYKSVISRIIVAAGGGGTSYYNGDGYYVGINGNGGGLHGKDGAYKELIAPSQYSTWYTSHKNQYWGFGATQTTGGQGGLVGINAEYGGTNGSFGQGGNAKNVDEGIAGGGGGYYGGGSTSRNSYSAGGGSSFISGHNGCVAITEDSTEDNIKQRTDSNGKTCLDGTTDITCSYHYSGYKFTDTVMIDGAGYNWTTVKGDYVGQPQPDGTTKEGHSGNGYARITYLGN